MLLSKTSLTALDKGDNLICRFLFFYFLYFFFFSVEFQFEEGVADEGEKLVTAKPPEASDSSEKPL